MKYYEFLEQTFRRVNHLNHFRSLASWDTAVLLPKNSVQARSEAMSELTLLKSEILQSPQISEAIQEAKAGEMNLNNFQKANLREMEFEWNYYAQVEGAVMAEKTRLGFLCESQWRQSRKENNFASLEPLLSKVVAIVKEEAQQRAFDTELSPYEALINIYEPGMRTEKLDTLFGDLKKFIPKLMEKIKDKKKDEMQSFPSISKEKQIFLGRMVMEKLGFDFDRGRVDESIHPFCGGVPEDVRITSRYTEDNFLEGLYAIIHETGHARYEQSLPNFLMYQPVNEARSFGIHEGQSLFFEMQLGRSNHFIKFLGPLIGKAFGVKWGSTPWTESNLLSHIHNVEPGYIRVNADEVTYPLHVILRYEIEKKLISGQMSVKELPEIWDLKMQQYLGLSTKENDRDGCMQDIHWMDGSFGYFPSYTLGAMNAAQLFYSASTHVKGLDEQIERGDFEHLLNWLSHAVWQKGRLLSTADLMKSATGEELNARYFENHLEARYLS